MMAMVVHSIRDKIRSDVKNFGIFRTFHILVFKAINKITFCTVLKCLFISTPDPGFLKGNDNYEHAFLNREKLFELAKNGNHELSEEFLRGALAKGDECYGIMDGKALASYGWYSNKTTGVSFADSDQDGKELRLSFSDEYVYMYKGYTHEKYRGQRLHAIGMTKALEEYLGRGFKGIVSYVESSNYSSLKSCYRMGYVDFGSIIILKIFGKYLIYNSSGCKVFKFGLKQV